MKTKKFYIIAVVVLAIAAGGYYYFEKKNSSKNRVQYITAEAKKGTLISSVSASGNIIVDQTSNIDPTITGTVANLAVKVGDKVKKGQFLFNIENDDLSVAVSKAEASLASAQSSLESAKAARKQARADLETATSKNKATLKEKWEATEASIASAEKNLIAAQAELANQRSKAAERRVVSPIDGTINEINIKNGDDLGKLTLGSSRQIPMIIGDLETMKARVQINEVDIAKISVGQKAVLKLDALGSFEASGVVEKIDSLGANNQGVVAYNVTISFDSLDSRIKPEMSVSASIITGVKQNVLIVPSSAVKSQGEKNYVEVLNGAVPERKNVTIGASSNTETEIVSGLSEGDKVVTQTINSSSATSSSSGSASRNNSFRLPGIGGGRPD